MLLSGTEELHFSFTLQKGVFSIVWSAYVWNANWDMRRGPSDGDRRNAIQSLSRGRFYPSLSLSSFHLVRLRLSLSIFLSSIFIFA